MKLLKFAVFLVVQTALIWVVPAFALWEPHPASWSVDARTLAGFAWAGVALCVLIIALLEGWE